MPKRDDDLFTRLRRAGVRKPVAKTLSRLTEDASTKAVDAGHLAVAELRALADEIEKRLPAAKPEPAATSQPTPVRRRATAPAVKRPGTARRASAAKPAAAVRKPASRPRAATARPAAAAATTRPRGENKAEILAALKAGPMTASEVSQQTGIARPTVSAALTRLAKSGEAVKATRGYGLPS